MAPIRAREGKRNLKSTLISQIFDLPAGDLTGAKEKAPAEPVKDFSFYHD